MTGFNQIERSRRSRGCLQRAFLCSRPEQKGFSPPGAIYIRISTSQQQTDRQETELKEFALRNGLNFNEKTDMYIDIISGFKEEKPGRSIPFSRTKWKPDCTSRFFSASLADLTENPPTFSIELLTARGMDGKISAIRSHGIHIGGFTPQPPHSASYVQSRLS